MIQIVCASCAEGVDTKVQVDGSYVYEVCADCGTSELVLIDWNEVPTVEE
jgi:ribosome-binding protein aMBF1 (putative translation factor)